MRVESSEALAALERAEREKMRLKIESMKAMKINCLVNRQLIYSWPAQLLADAGIAVIEHADFDGVERLAFVTGAQIASYFGQEPNHDASPSAGSKTLRLGKASVVEEILVGGERLTRFSGVKGGDGHGACTVVLRGSSRQMLDEAERSLHDALCVLVQVVRHDTRTVLGAGCIEMLMSKSVDEIAAKVPGKQALAIEAFSRALRMVSVSLPDHHCLPFHLWSHLIDIYFVLFPSPSHLHGCRFRPFCPKMVALMPRSLSHNCVQLMRPIFQPLGLT